jgi:hypothetical protein
MGDSPENVLALRGSCNPHRKRLGGGIAFRWDCSRAEQTMKENKSEEMEKAGGFLTIPCFSSVHRRWTPYPAAQAV